MLSRHNPDMVSHPLLGKRSGRQDQLLSCSKRKRFMEILLQRIRNEYSDIFHSFNIVLSRIKEYGGSKEI